MGYTGVTEDFIVADPKGGGTLEKLAVAIGPIRLKARQTRYGVRAVPLAAIPRARQSVGPMGSDPIIAPVFPAAAVGPGRQRWG